jgi:formylglycine-generating enzyme
VSAAALRRLALLGLLLLSACDRKERGSPSASASSATVLAASGPPPPAQLYLPDGGDVALTQPQVFVPAPMPTLGRCPADMVDVRGRFCIDRYEAVLADPQGRSFSPYFPPSRAEAKGILAKFRSMEPIMADPPAMPILPDWQRQEDARPMAQSRAAVVPNGYLSGIAARAACEAAGKRLCSGVEWELACRGEQDRQFPYGDRYEQGRCNVFRETHPAAALHGDASRNHLDPRLNLVQGSAGPLLRKTGSTPECKSQWGSDAIYDMVGNLDEWIDDPEGTFAGGFFSRGSREGCSSRVAAHPIEYMDYSLGVRCCR